MKKIIALALAAAICISAAACSRQPSNNGEGSSAASQSGASSENASEESVFVRGTVTNGVYKNDSMGITVNPGEGWTFLSDEEMAELYGISVDFFTEDAAAELESSGVVYDMYCQNDEGSSINVNFDKGNLLAGLAVDEEAYLELSSSSLESSLDASAGFTVAQNEIGKIEINGGTVPCLYVTLVYPEYGVSIYEAVIAKKTGSCFAAITIAALSESAVEDLAKAVTTE